MRLLSLLAVIAIALAGSAQTNVNQEYATANKNWPLSGSPYVLTENITISDSLIIQPGVQVSFGYQRTITVTGKVKALGNATDSVRFVGTDPTAS